MKNLGSYFLFSTILLTASFFIRIESALNFRSSLFSLLHPEPFEALEWSQDDAYQYHPHHYLTITLRESHSKAEDENIDESDFEVDESSEDEVESNYTTTEYSEEEKDDVKFSSPNNIDNGSGGDGDDGGEASDSGNGEIPQSVDDIEEVSTNEESDLSDEAFDSEDIMLSRLADKYLLQNIWKENFIQYLPKSDSTLITSDSDLSLTKPNGTDRDTFYKQILNQLQNPFISTGKKVRWLDQDFALNLKGMAVLNLFPRLLEETTGGTIQHFRRGIRIVSTKSENLDENDSSGYHAIHQLVVKALANSVNADLVNLNIKIIEKVQQLANEQRSSRAPITKADALSSLFELFGEGGLESGSLIAVLNDDLEWLLRNEAASEVVLRELKSSTSRIMFIALEPDGDLKSGQTLPSTAAQQAANSNKKVSESEDAVSGDQPNGMMPQFPPNFAGFMGPVPPGMAPFPFPPPGAIVSSRSFQVVVQNGTATMIPLPPGTFPPGFPGMPPGIPQGMPQGMPPGMQGIQMPRPPEAVMKRIMAEQQKMLQQMQQQQQQQQQDRHSNIQADNFNLTGVPPEMEEEVKEFLKFLQKNENQAKLKGIFDSVIGMLTQFNQQSSGTNEDSTQAQRAIPSHPVSSSKNARASNAFLRAIRNKNAQQGNSASDSKESKGKNANDIDQSIISPSGHSLMSHFDTLNIEAPRDHLLKSLWEQIIDEEISRKILLVNRKILQQELKRSKIEYPSMFLLSLEDVLNQQVLSRAQAREAIFAAVKLQAGILSLGSKPVKDGLKLSIWALDTALSSILKVATPRLAKPIVRTKEEISNMAIDKHEKGLINNVISPQDIGVTYDMIGGLEEVKEMLRQAITYPLKYPRLYQEGVANEAVKGVLLFGPPGTGKTMLAKAVATEGGATFLSVDTSTIENKWLGESEKNARAVFTLARKLAPCVIYLDEVDSVLSSREHGDDSSHGTLTSVKTTLMQEWDGLRTTKDRVVVIASTNRPFDLDEAVLRRLPRRIMVDLPDLKTRTEILSVTLANNRMAPDVNFTKLAESLEGFTGSDIKEVCREAVVRVSHERAQQLESGIRIPHTNDTLSTFDIPGQSNNSSLEIFRDNDMMDDVVNAPLRAVTSKDFDLVLKKLKASVDESGREMQKVQDWNEKFGEIKRGNRRKGSANLNMYI